MKFFISKLSALFFVLLSIQAYSQDQDGQSALYNALLEQERNLKDEQFKNPLTSPLIQTDIDSFKSLSYFDPNKSYKVPAQINVLEEQVVVTLNTSGDKKIDLIKYATVTFMMENKEYTLTVFRDQNLPELSENPGQLFIPYKDKTSGTETNANGRYIAISKPAEGTSIEIDFNKSFNPYSAYNSFYSSVIPPEENLLEVVVASGERKYEDR